MHATIRWPVCTLNSVSLVCWITKARFHSTPGLLECINKNTTALECKGNTYSLQVERWRSHIMQKKTIFCRIMPVSCTFVRNLSLLKFVRVSSARFKIGIKKKKSLSINFEWKERRHEEKVTTLSQQLHIQSKRN